MSKPWFKMYEKHTPKKIDIPKFLLQHYMEQAAVDYPEGSATVFAGTKKNWRELNAESNRIANALINMGVKPGDIVALLMANSPMYVSAYFGILKAGAIVTALNPLYSPREIEFQLNDTGAETLIIVDVLYPQFEPVKDKTKVKNVIVTWLGDALPGFKATLGKLLKKIPTYKVPPQPGHYFWKALLTQSSPEQPSVKFGDPKKTIATILYTGGTTGTPKGAMLTHYNLVANVEQLIHWLPEPQMGQEGFVVALPLYHSYAMTTCMLAATKLASEMLLLPKPDLGEILKDIDKHKPTFFMGVPAMYIGLINRPDVAQYDLKSVNYCISGAAALPMEVSKKFGEITGANLVEGYGLTETSPVTHCAPLQKNPPFDKKREGSIGVPLPNTQAKIVDLETGKKKLGIDEIGELVIKGPQVMMGYWKKPNETKNQLKKGWVKTGDIAKMDKDGYFYIVDRLKDMIDRAGFKIYPRDVEEVLFQHPAIKEAAVIGAPDPVRGETVKAVIVLKEGQTVTTEQIQEFCKDKLAKYKIPDIIEFRDELPKTMVGKVLRRVLKEEN